MTAAATETIEVFYSYAHEDEELRNELDKHLSLLRRQGVIAGWHDRRISAGREWAQDIDAHLNSAQIILLLISADFLASDYCYSVEMQHAQQRHEAGEARVIPVILRSVEWLQERMYTFGAIYLPEDLMKRVTGEVPDSRHFADYLTHKFEAIYRL